MSIAIEAAELMEHFQWLAPDEALAAVGKPAERAAVADELADILIYCLSLSNALELDISSAVLGKLQTNEHRYPVGEFRGALPEATTRQRRSEGNTLLAAVSGDVPAPTTCYCSLDNLPHRW